MCHSIRNSLIYKVMYILPSTVQKAADMLHYLYVIQDCCILKFDENIEEVTGS